MDDKALLQECMVKVEEMQLEMDCPATYLKQENDLKEDPLALDPLAGCEEWNETKPLAESLLLRVKKEVAVKVEPKEEAEAGISDERNEQMAFKEMQNDEEDASGSNRAESQSEECEALKAQNQFDPTLSNSQWQYISKRALSSNFEVDNNEAKRKTNFSCETCGKEFKYRSNLKVHQHIHIGEKPYVCNYCGKGFTQGSTLNEHLRNHSGEWPYSCFICNRRFTYQSNLVKHKKQHMNTKPYECKACGKTFVYNSEYTVHLRRHAGEKPYKCSVCLEAFVRKSFLNRHMFTHSNEQKQMSECEVCGVSFKTTYMNAHILTHTRDKPYKCRFCEETFTASSNQVKHEQRHLEGKVFQCDVCGKSLSSKKNVEIHMRRHTGERPFKCGYCDRTFAQLGSRKTHEVRHTKVHPYKCVECGRGYIGKKQFVKHIKTHGH